MNDDSIEAKLSIGSRCQMKVGGRRSQRLQGRKGTVVGFAQTKNAVRVVFDGYKSPQTLHLSYLLAVPPTVMPNGGPPEISGEQTEV